MMQRPTTAPAEPQSVQRVSGMDCPVCRKFIPISIPQLLYDGGIMCPNCGLMMTINKSLSRKALEALKKVEDATKKVRETESFKR